MNIADLASPTNSDATQTVRAAFQVMKSREDKRLVFPTGRYDFWSDRAEEQYLFLSNNDASLKRLAFNLTDFDDLEIDGQGSQFVFHGGIVPFYIATSSNIHLKNLTIDWERTFHSELEVLTVTVEETSSYTTVTLRVPDAYPYRIEHGRLDFLGERGERYVMENVLEFDPGRRETAFQVRDNYELHQNYRAEEIEPGHIRITGDFATVPTPGNVLVFVHTLRYFPGFAITDSRNITLTDITLHHAGAMGVIAQRTEDILLERVSVIPAAHKDRIVSATADATHFVNCRGQITLRDCRFIGQMDDPGNIHGVYARISRILSPTEIEIELVHHQQFGLDITQAGDTLEFVSRETLLRYHTATVSATRRLNQQYTVVTLSTPLPETVRLSDVVGSLHWVPNVTITGCDVGNNRARGFLLSTAGKVLVENTHFHTPGAAILIAGDANYWFESGAVRDVTIRNNHFDNCNYGVWGRATIDICPEIEPQHRGSDRYHHNITIEDNTFDAFDQRLVKAHCVDGLTIRNNRIRPSTDYPAPENEVVPFDIMDCSQVEID